MENGDRQRENVALARYAKMGESGRVFEQAAFLKLSQAYASIQWGAIGLQQAGDVKNEGSPDGCR